MEENEDLKNSMIEMTSKINTIKSILLKLRRTLYKQPTENLRESEEKYRTNFETTGTATAIIEEDGIISMANIGFEKLTGYSKEELERKKSWAEFLTKDDLKRMKEYHRMRRIDPNTIPRSYACKLINRMGNDRHVHLTVDLLPEKKSIVSALDITVFKQTVDELQKNERCNRILTENVRDVICTLDMHLKFTYISPSVKYLTGYSVEEAMAKTPDEILTPSSLKIAMEDLAEVLSIEGIEKKNICQSRTSEFEVICKDGSTVWTEVKMNFIRDSNGRPVEILGVVRDINERKKLERQLHYFATHDPLTGLYNRIYFEQEMHRLESKQLYPAGIIICDLDGIKLINDSLGHKTGDALLISVAQILRKSLCENNVIARIDGDRFAALIQSSENILEICQLIHCNVVNCNVKNPALPLSLSMGFAIGGKKSKKIDELFKEAENKLYLEKLRQTQSARSAIVQTLKKIMEARDFITEDHSERLVKLVSIFADNVGLSERSKTDLRLLAKFHDIGKVGIPDSILFKPGPLNSEEFEEMKRHSEIGYRIAISSPELATIADWILKHHEWWNGKGYPIGLKKKEIPLECRILAIVDAYEAMTSDRIYRKAMYCEAAVAEIRRCAGTQFDPYLVKKYIHILEHDEHRKHQTDI